MYYGMIKEVDIADGEGVRVSLFVSGCRNCCKGCFQKETWNFCYGRLFTKETEDHILQALGRPFIAGFSLLGGEPFEEENQAVLAPFLARIKAAYPGKDIWCFTGYVFDRDLKPAAGRKRTEFTDQMLSCIDVLVDGPFIAEQKDVSLRFRGSRNQRVLHLRDGELVGFLQEA